VDVKESDGGRRPDSGTARHFATQTWQAAILSRQWAASPRQAENGKDDLMRVALSAGLGLLTLVAGAAWAQGPLFGGPGLFVSPAGEPFRRAPDAPPPLDAWFAGADADRDGALSRDEMRADFARAFAQFDTDGDGEIEPTEVARYEMEVLPEMRGAAAGRRGGAGARSPVIREMRGDRRRRGGGRPVGATMMMAGAAPFGVLPISHPIMDADVDFNGGVSRDEFRTAADRRFGLLDPGGMGRLTLDQLREFRRRRGRLPG